MNLRAIAPILGTMALVCSIMASLPLIIALVLQENSVGAFWLTMMIGLILSFELKRHGLRDSEQLSVQGSDQLSVREGVAITGLGWLIFFSLGTIPFISGGYLNPLDSLVESVAGFSTIGATVVPNVEALPKSVLLWRSLSNWVGGLGLIIIFMALVPQLNRGSMHMFQAESTGPTKERTLPRIRDNAKALLKLYTGLTVAAFICYMLCGAAPFPALNHAMTTIATGGFSVYNDGVMHDNNALLEACMVFFMIISSSSFAMYLIALRQGAGVLWHNTEFKAYLLLLLAASVLVSLDLAWEMHMTPFEAVRYGVFQVASMASTTGFVSHDFDTWPAFAKCILLLLMFTGGCAGSTAGGLKISRFVLLLKTIHAVILEKLHPQQIIHVRMNGRVVPNDVIYTVLRFFFIYVMLDIIFAFIMVFDGLPLVDAVSVSISCVGSVGPGFGVDGATSSFDLLPPFSRFMACFAMFIGRLEIFNVLALFLPEFWHRKKGW